MAQPRLQSDYPGVDPGVRQFIGARTRKMLIDGKWVEAASGKTLTTYDPASSGTQFVDSTATTSWRHRVDPLTTVSLTSQLEWLNYDTTPVANLLLWQNTAGFETTLSPVLSYGVNAGVIYSNSEIGSLSASPFVPPAFLAPVFASGSAVGSGKRTSTEASGGMPGFANARSSDRRSRPWVAARPRVARLVPSAVAIRRRTNRTASSSMTAGSIGSDFAPTLKRRLAMVSSNSRFHAE